MDWRKAVAGLTITILPAGAVAAAYRKEGLEEPHISSEVVPLGDWSYGQRISIVSGTVVQVHNWAATQIQLVESKDSGSGAG